MKKFLFLLSLFLILPLLDQSFAFADAAQTQITTSAATPTAPAEVTTTVKGGTLAAQVLEWLQVAFGTALATFALGVLYKIMNYFGIQTTDLQRQQLQSIVVHGINNAAARAEVSLRGNPELDIQVKNKIIADAIDYTQRHAPETIRALGFDPNSGEAVEAIRARINTALNDPATPTPDVITPDSGKLHFISEQT
jgi:hypothetical protein